MARGVATPIEQPTVPSDEPLLQEQTTWPVYKMRHTEDAVVSSTPTSYRRSDQPFLLIPPPSPSNNNSNSNSNSNSTPFAVRVVPAGSSIKGSVHETFEPNGDGLSWKEVWVSLLQGGRETGTIRKNETVRAGQETYVLGEYSLHDNTIRMPQNTALPFSISQSGVANDDLDRWIRSARNEALIGVFLCATSLVTHLVAHIYSRVVWYRRETNNWRIDWSTVNHGTYTVHHFVVARLNPATGEPFPTDRIDVDEALQTLRAGQFTQQAFILLRAEQRSAELHLRFVKWAFHKTFLHRVVAEVMRYASTLGTFVALASLVDAVFLHRQRYA